MKRLIHGVSDEAVYGFPIYCMSVWRKQRTGLPYDVWVDDAANERNTKHNLPRIKIKVDGRYIPFIIDDNPRYVSNRNVPHASQIINWIRLNKDVLLKQWNQELSADEAFTQLKHL